MIFSILLEVVLACLAINAIVKFFAYKKGHKFNLYDLLFVVILALLIAVIVLAKLQTSIFAFLKEHMYMYLVYAGTILWTFAINIFVSERIDKYRGRVKKEKVAESENQVQE